MKKKIFVVIGLVLLLVSGVFIGKNLDGLSFSGGKDGLSYIREQAALGAGGGKSKEGELAANFALTDIDGKKFTLADFAGSPVILEIMATWCGTCISETDDFRKALEAYPQLFIISIDVDPTETDKEIDRFRRAYSKPEYDNRWLFASDIDQVSAKYGAPFTGTTILVDKDGKISYRDSWSTDFSEIEKAMSELGYVGNGSFDSTQQRSVDDSLADYNLNLEQEIDDLKELYGNQGIKVATIKIENMFCPSCPKTIKDVLYNTVPGVKEVRISFYESKGLVVYDPEQSSTDDIINSPIFDNTLYPDAATIYDASLLNDQEI